MKNTINNNEIFLALIDLGKTNLITPDFESRLNELRKYSQELLSTIDFKEILLEYLKDFKIEINNAKEILSNIDLITSEEGDNIWIEAEESFYTLDKLNYLKEALYNILAEYERQNLTQAFDKINETETNIIDWLHDSDFSPLRLSVLNKIRKAHLDIIPEEKQYLFPWYYLCSEYKESMINTLIENYDIFSNKEKSVPAELEPYLNEITYELQRDEELLSVIKNEYAIHNGILKAFSKRSSLRLLHISYEASPQYEISEHLEKAGLVRTANKLIRDNPDPLMHFTERIYWLFLSAFCGPKLNDAQRLELLEKVEAAIKPMNTEKIDGDVGKILNQLKRWFNNEIEDNWLPQISLTHWKKLLEAKAATMTVSKEDENVAVFWDTLSSLSNLITFKRLIEIVLTINIIPIRIENFVPLRQHYGPAEEKASLIRIENNPLTLSILPNNNSEYLLLAAPQFIKDCDNLEEYEKFWKKFDRLQFYWGGYFFDDNAVIFKKIDPVKIEQKFFYRTSEGKGAIIGISDNENQLKKFIEFIDKLKISIEEPQQLLPKDKFDKIIVLIISFEKKELP